MKPTDLVWIRYREGNRTVYRLILYLGEQGGHVHCFIADMMPDRDKMAVRANLDALLKMTFPELVAWCHANLATSYTNKAYRTLLSSNMEVEKTFSIKKV